MAVDVLCDLCKPSSQNCGRARNAQLSKPGRQLHLNPPNTPKSSHDHKTHLADEWRPVALMRNANQ